MQEGFWNKKIVVQVVLFTVVIFTTCILLFHDRLVQPAYIFAGLLVVGCFFLFSNRLFNWWSWLNTIRFEKRLFTASLILRVGAAIGLYLFYRAQTGEPFEYYAVDSKFYHTNALKLVEYFRLMDLNLGNHLAEMAFSDTGYNIYLGALYTLSGKSILFTRLINALLSSLTVIFIYRTAKYTAGEHTARIAGITAMLLPNFLLYLGTGLKETLMVFLVSALLLQTVRFVTLGKKTIITVVSILFILFSLFLFRTVLATVMCMSFVLYAMATNPLKQRWLNIFSTITIMAIFLFLLWNTPVGNEIEEYVAKTGNVSDHMEFRATRDGGNKLAVLAGAPLFLSVILIAPFPSFIYVPEQDILWMFIGGNLVRNIYAWFTILGLIYALKNNFRKNSLVIIYTLGYLGILANSGFALSERFHVPAVPGLIILSAIGITHYEQKTRKYFPIYLFVLGLFVIGWNYIKIAGRV